MPMRLEGSCRCDAISFSVESHTPYPYHETLDDIGSQPVAIWLRAHTGSFETGKIFSLPSCGGRYHAPSIPIDLHWESNRVPARLLTGFTVVDEQFHARLWRNIATRLSTMEWLWAAKRA